MFAASRNAVTDSQPASVFMALTESALLSRSASRSSEVAIPRSPPYGLGTVLPGGHEIPELRVGGEPPYIDGRYRTGSVRDFRAEVHVRAVLYGIIEFTRRFEPELPVDRYRLCVVLQDFQQVLPDSGLPQVGDGVFEDLCGEPLPAIGFEGSRAGVVGCRQAVEIPCPVQGERGDPLPVERGERQAGIETAPAQHAPELCFVQLDFVIGECLAECLGQRAKARFFQ